MLAEFEEAILTTDSGLMANRLRLAPVDCSEDTLLLARDRYLNSGILSCLSGELFSRQPGVFFSIIILVFLSFVLV